MSRPRSRSPHYRRLQWEKPNYHSHQAFSEREGNPMDRSHRFREAPEEPRNYFREDRYPEGQRRPPLGPDDHQFGRHLDKFYHKRLSPRHDVMRHEDRRPPPLHNAGVDIDRRRGGFREGYHGFEDQRRSPQSPLRLKRERLPTTAGLHSNHQQRETGMGWRRDEQDRGRKRFRDASPSMSSDDQRDRGRRTEEGPNKSKQREHPHLDRKLPFKRQRREMDDSNHLGYRNEEDFGGQGYSVDTPRDGFGGDKRVNFPPGDVRHFRPLIVEHDHGNRDDKGSSRWHDTQRDRDPDFHRERAPRPMGASQERFRMSDNSLEVGDSREHHFQDNLRDSTFHDTRRSPDNRGGFMGGRGRGPVRRGYNQSHSRRIGPPRNQGSFQDLSHEEQTSEYQPLREDHKDPIQERPKWTEEDRLQQWEHDRPQSLDRRFQRDDLGSKIPHQRERGWSNQKADDMTVVTEETLTIKVDMSQPVNQNSPLCYSSDRQLSLDLVNVGRQRLDFLPMLEHSGMYRETAMHTGTFAQEIITLVHLVKEQYFRDDGVTLNERFSASHKSSFSEEEVEELTLDQRFSSNRGFNLDMKSLHDDVPLFSRLGPMQGLGQPVRGPGDLRHDLERRRQEKLEGVRVTIQGNSVPQHPLGAGREPDMEYSIQTETSQLDDNGFSNWPEEEIGRREGRMGPRRGPSNRPITGPQQRTNRFGNQRLNIHSGSAGSNW
ncbi:BCLAF1 and THRAP3 family member 3 [Parambassis ranga]|uniref:BCLAF1 and THRAP3 family member 3 n=1 Tax=Parambassis ranga TaxID=210632 RepID=A0A6P7KIN4_9TELE|nr:BCLAF1 and THRAP3 family member 3-like [Parambassis ranga]